jgi:hypothetical protein
MNGLTAPRRLHESGGDFRGGGWQRVYPGNGGSKTAPYLEVGRILRPASASCTPRILRKTNGAIDHAASARHF